MENENYFASRRTVRNYSEKSVEMDVVDRMLELAAKAPTTGNMQLCCAIVSNEEQKKSLEAAHFNQPAAVTAPVLVTFCADFNLFYRWCELNGTHAGFDNLQGMLMGIFDAVIFAQQFVTIAEMNGFGTCYLGTTTYNVEKIAAELKLPDNVLPLLTVSVGYGQGVPEEAGRLPVGAYVHHGEYARREDEDTLALYAEKEGREDSKRFVAENGLDNLAQVFAQIRYPESMLKDFSGVLEKFIRERF